MRTLTLTTWALAVIAIAFADETIEKTSLRGSDVVKAVDAVTVSKEAIAVVASEDALVTPQQGKFVTRQRNVAFNLLTSQHHEKLWTFSVNFRPFSDRELTQATCSHE